MAKPTSAFTRRADALFELGDALLCAGSFLSLPHLSLELTRRRGWGSAYAALASGRVDAERLRDLLVGCLPPADPLVFAVDVTTWPRCDAKPESDRTGQPFRVCQHGLSSTGQTSGAAGTSKRCNDAEPGASSGRDRHRPGPRALGAGSCQLG
jgi:hypothetical protein